MPIMYEKKGRINFLNNYHILVLLKANSLNNFLSILIYVLMHVLVIYSYSVPMLEFSLVYEIKKKKKRKEKKRKEKKRKEKKRKEKKRKEKKRKEKKRKEKKRKEKKRKEKKRKEKKRKEKKRKEKKRKEKKRKEKKKKKKKKTDLQIQISVFLLSNQQFSIFVS